MLKNASINFDVQDVDAKIASLDVGVLGVKHKDGKSYQVAPGLQIHLSLKNKKTWRLRYVDLNGKAKNPKIGDFPAMSFQEAKSVLNETLDSIAKGEEPAISSRKQLLASTPKTSKPKLLFKDAFQGFCDYKRGDGNKKLAKWAESTLDKHQIRFNKHVLPYLGLMDVSDISVKDLTRVLKEIETKGIVSVRDKVFTVLRDMYDWMIGKNFEGDECYPEFNLANAIPTKIFIKNKPENFKHITTRSEAKLLVNQIYNMRARFEIKQALKLQLHLFFRPVILAELKWNEVNFLDELGESDTEHKYDFIEIPKERMKMNRDFVSTISPQARALLLEMRKKSGNSEFVFQSSYRAGDKKPISRDSLANALKRNGINQISTHGFRHMSSTLLRDELGFDQDSSAIEVQLSHEIGGVEGFYNKAKYLDKRYEIMNKWSNFIESLIEKPKVEEKSEHEAELFF
jgi:integrase